MAITGYDQSEAAANELNNALAIAQLLTSNPVVQALARTTQNGQTLRNSAGAANTQGADDSNPATQALVNSLLAQQSAPASEHTTRSGRVSRPPANPTNSLEHVLQVAQALAAQAGRSGNATQAASQGGDSTGQAGNIAPFTRFDAPMPASDAMNRNKRPHQTAFEEVTENGDPRQSVDLPSWPLPATGKGSRKGIPKEEILARRKERNKTSAIASRQQQRDRLAELEQKVKQLEDEVNTQQKECDDWRQKYQTLENKYGALSSVWTAMGFVLPSDTVTPRTIAGLATAHSTYTPGSMGPPPVPLSAVRSLPRQSPLVSSTNSASPGMFATPQSVNSNGNSTLAPAPSLPPIPSIPSVQSTDITGSSPAETPSFDIANLDLSAFDHFFNWDNIPENDPDEQEDGDFFPASSPKQSDSDASDTEATSQTQSRSKKKRKGKKRSRRGNDDEDDDEFIDPEVDEEDLFLPIKDVAVPPGQMQLVEQATQDVMTTFGVESQGQLTDVMQKMLDAGEGLTAEQLEKMKSVLRWMQRSGHVPMQWGD